MGRKPRLWEHVSTWDPELPRAATAQTSPRPAHRLALRWAGGGVSGTALLSPCRTAPEPAHLRLAGPLTASRGGNASAAAADGAREPQSTDKLRGEEPPPVPAWQTQTRELCPTGQDPKSCRTWKCEFGEPRAWLPFSSVKSQINMQKGHVASQASRVPGCVRSRSYCAAKGDPLAVDRPLKVTLPRSSRLPPLRPRGTRH